MWWTGEDGQGSVEYVMLIAVVAAVLVVAAAAVGPWSPTIRNAVTSGFQRALCVVSGERCEMLRREPCPVLRTTETSRQGVALGFLRLGHDRALFIERRSDGTYAMSLVEGAQAGAGVAAGAKLGAAEFSAEASLMAGGRAGRTYVAPNAQAARALVEGLRHQRLPALRSIAAGVADLAGLARADPSVSSYVLAGEAAGDAAANFGIPDLVGADAGAGNHQELGVQVSAHAKELTVYARTDPRIGVFFDALSSITATHHHSTRGRSGGAGGDDGSAGEPNDGPGSSGSGAADDAEPSKGSIDSPLGVDWAAQGLAGGSVSLRFAPGPRLLGAEVVGYAGNGSVRHEVRARVDATDPSVAAALHAWLASPTSPRALSALGDAARSTAVLDERRFEMRASQEHEFSAQVAELGALGISAQSGMVTGRLTEQRTRPQGGVWERRLDCEAVA